MARKYRRGFTLIEAIVIIAIIGLLAAILVPAIMAAREAGRRASCTNNLKQFGLALHNYEAAYGTFPPGYGDLHGESLHVRLLPYLELSNIYNALNHDIFIMDNGNSTIASVSISVFLCPSDGYSAGERNNYGGCIGVGQLGTTGVFGKSSRGEKYTHVPDIHDGLSTTVAMSEFLVGRTGIVDRLRTFYEPVGGTAADIDAFVSRCASLEGEVPAPVGDASYFKGYTWMVGDDARTLYNHASTCNRPSCRNTRNSPLPSVSLAATSHHGGGVNCLLADGHVRFVRDTISPRAWRALATRDAGEVVAEDEY